jgi:hypothetical protein
MLVADVMSEPKCRRGMINTAAGYERLAESSAKLHVRA